MRDPFLITLEERDILTEIDLPSQPERRIGTAIDHEFNACFMSTALTFRKCSFPRRDDIHRFFARLCRSLRSACHELSSFGR